ncbi:MAG TPA: cation:proton antiporter [Steroidobacteraceae bacterium]|nr:cation:proton antiporter [Steroidobacteraceae bacterium]
MSRELAYLLLICCLLVVPGLMQRLRIPPPLTCFMLGLALVLGLPDIHRHDDAVHLLAALGISTLFLYAGLEVDLASLRRAVGPLSAYLLTRACSVAALAWAGQRWLALGWQDATLLALALLTSSTGFIIDSLDRFGLESEERFWVTNNAISGELLALAIMFVVLKATDPTGLALATLALGATLVALPLAFLALGRWIVPYGAGSAFSLLIMVGFAAAFVTDRLGVEYLLGAFLAGLVARLMENRVPALASHENLRAVKLFSSFFLPFYFFARGAGVPPDALSFEALGIGVALTLTLVPLRALAIWAKRRLLNLGDTRSSLRVAAALTPTLIFTLVLATILKGRGAISDAFFGGLLLYAALNTMLPSFVLRAPFDVAPSPLQAPSRDGG